MKQLRKYHLASEDRGIGSDRNYSLIFTDTGEMYVRQVEDFEQPYKTPTVNEIYPSEFGKILVEGEPLREIVIKKLDEILPKVPAPKLPPGVEILNFEPS
jgi:hypothetical protein